MAVYTDIPNNFATNTITKDLSLKENLAAVRQSIINLLTYDYSDKPFHPEKIIGLHRVLFEPLDNITIQALQKNLISKLEYYEPRIKILVCTLTPLYEDQSVKIDIVYKIKNFEETYTITHFFYRTR